MARRGRRGHRSSVKRDGQLRRLAALQRKTPMKRTRWMKRRASEPVELTKAKKVVRQRSGGLCEAQVMAVCTAFAMDAHHVLRRSQGGSHEPSNLRDCCRHCHRWIHEHVYEATQLGLLKSGHKEFGHN